MLGVDAIIAVDVGSTELVHVHDVGQRGFAAIFMRAATTMMNALQGRHLVQHRGIPTLYVRPPITGVDWFSFGRADALVEAGRTAAEAALAELDQCTTADDGLFPLRRIRLEVDRRRCIGCGICVALAPDLMRLEEFNRRNFRWCGCAGCSHAFVHSVAHCAQPRQKLSKVRSIHAASSSPSCVVIASR